MKGLQKHLDKFQKAVEKALQEMTDRQDVINEFFFNTLDDKNKKLLVEKMEEHKENKNRVPDLDELKEMIEKAK